MFGAAELQRGQAGEAAIQSYAGLVQNVLDAGGIPILVTPLVRSSPANVRVFDQSAWDKSCGASAPSLRTRYPSRRSQVLRFTPCLNEVNP